MSIKMKLLIGVLLFFMLTVLLLVVMYPPSDIIGEPIGVNGDSCEAACAQYQYICTEDKLYNQLPLCNDPNNPNYNKICECKGKQ